MSQVLQVSKEHPWKPVMSIQRCWSLWRTTGPPWPWPCSSLQKPRAWFGSKSDHARSYHVCIYIYLYIFVLYSIYSTTCIYNIHAYIHPDFGYDSFHTSGFFQNGIVPSFENGVARNSAQKKKKGKKHQTGWCSTPHLVAHLLVI